MLCFYIIMPVVVVVSNPDTVVVREDHGFVELCSTLSTKKSIERNLTISMATRNETGMTNLGS